MSERSDEMFFDLALAVTRGDLAAAQESLDLMMRVGVNADLILQARRKAHPRRPSIEVEALPLPMSDQERAARGFSPYAHPRVF